nr:putative ribonuclease H-like domain-containing protein [Tanacetum cinerariifolium]
MFEKPNVEANVWRDQKGRYGLAKQMLDNVSLEVEEESEMSLELLRSIPKGLHNDIIFGSTKKELCTEFEKLMHDKVQMSLMGELTFFLGLQVKQKSNGIFISQDKYVDEILRKFKYEDVKPASIQWIKKRLCSKIQMCKKQTVVATFTTEAEYVAASSCCGQVLWIQNQLLDYGRHLKLADADGISTLPTTKIFEQLALMGKTRTRIRRIGIRITHFNVPSSVADEAITKEMHDGLGRATTTASSLEAEQDSDKVTSLENKLKSTKAVYNKALITLTKRVKKLEKKLKYKRRRAVFDSSEDEETSLDNKDSPKQMRMIEEIDEDGNVNLVKSTQIQADEDLAQRMLEEERESLFIKKMSRLLTEFIDQRKKMLAAKRVEEKRNKPHTQAQQRTYMSNYIKNIGGYTLKALKQYSFEKIKMLFDKIMESIRKFVPIKSEGQIADSKAREGSSKEGKSLKRPAEEELGQEQQTKQKVKEDLSQEMLQQMMVIIPE